MREGIFVLPAPLLPPHHPVIVREMQFRYAGTGQYQNCIFYQILNQQVAETLLSDFHRIEEDAGGDRHTKYLRIANDLCERYGVSPMDNSLIDTIKNEFSPA